MLQKQKSSIIPGVLLVIIGLWLFIRQFSFFQFYWDKLYPVFLVLLGLLLIAEFWWHKQSGIVFWGVIAFVVGIFYILRNFELIPYFYADEYWPIFLIAMGIGFVALFLINLKDWGILIPACLFLFFGIGFLFHTLDYSYWGWIEFLNHYWPVVFILIGIVLICNGIFRSLVKEKWWR